MSSNYFPFRFCEKCHTIKREDWMFSEDECLGCHENENPTREATGALGQIQKRSGIRKRLLAQTPRGAAQMPLFTEKEAV